MMRRSVFAVSYACLLSFCLQTWLSGQARNASLVGHVTDSAGAVVQQARVELQPSGATTTTDQNGNFQFSGLAPGEYTLTVSYVGFSIYSLRTMVTVGEPVRVNAVLQLGTHNEAVTVHADRQGGEVEALDIQRTADNVVQVLPADVITSLPNTNIADAVGRLPSISLERDEGEGKYIQIRGTEPRLSNVTIDGIHVPSPEGIRNVKLDVIPADLVESVEVNKTLSANQDADAIGGSVNLVSKRATEQPYLSLLGMGGYTPITGGRRLSQFAGTAGQRFGAEKKFGVLFGYSYDHNARGIDDVEPGQAVNTLGNGATFFGPNTEDIRNYHYDRNRYGLDGDLDYKLGEMSTVYLRGLFSHFNDYGEDWIYTPSISNFGPFSGPTDPNNTCGITGNSSMPQGCGGMGFTDVYRRPSQQILSVQAGARHPIGSTLITYELALSQANYTGGFSDAAFNGPGSADSSVAFGIDTRNPFIPKFPALNGVNIYDPTTYGLSFADTEKDAIFERDAVGDVSLNKQYSVGTHFSSIELGFKGWDARKTALYDRENYNLAGGQPMTQFLGSYRDNNYYFGSYIYGPTTEFSKVVAALQGGGITPNLSYNLRNDFDLSERIWAGYVMNTINFGSLRLQAGVRIESTEDALRAYGVDKTQSPFAISPVLQNNSYVNAFPSVQAQYRLSSNTALRTAYGMGIARPNFGDTAPYQIYDPNHNPTVPLIAGNPKLKPTHAQNFDLLAEHYLRALGLIEGGFFYKALTDPIYNVVTTVQTGQYAGKNEQQPINGPSAHISGIEVAWQQRLSFLPSALNAMGVRANYSYVASHASFPAGFGRSDHPTLLRTAPNNWNFDVTYDKKGVSARMGLTHNDAYIWSYGGTNAKDPSGDTYLYPHTQVDAQISYWIPRTHGLEAIISGLNLNNEVFGFYNGSERYPIQREYYSRTVSAGLRWTLGGEPH